MIRSSSSFFSLSSLKQLLFMILLFVDSIVVVVAPMLPKVVAVGDITGVRELFVSLPNKGGGVLTFMSNIVIR